MRFYETRVIADPSEDAGTIESRAKGVARAIDHSVKVLAVTVHARPTEGHRDRNDGAIMMINESDDPEAALHEFGGHFARRHGMPMVEYRKFGDETISLKAHHDTIEDAIEEALGKARHRDTGVEDPEDEISVSDDFKYENEMDGDEVEDFEIGEDRADE